MPKALQSFADGVALAREAGASTFRRWCERGLALAYAGLCRFDEARPLLPEPTPHLERQDRDFHAYMAVRILLDAGDVDEAVREAVQTLEVFDWDLRLSGAAMWFPDKAVELFLRLGEIGKAEQIASRAAAAPSGAGDPCINRMEGRLALAKGELKPALDRLTEAADFFGKVMYRDHEWRTRRVLAEVMARMGDRDGAEAQLKGVLAGAEEHGHLFEANSARKQLEDLGVLVAVPKSGGAPTETLREVSERLVTVMFVDVRGYTAMTGKEAPHEMADRISTFYRWAQQEIERHHGRATQHSGDSVMATFNISGVRLDHALHALQAAIAIRDKAAYGNLPVGIGIAVGAAVVGPLTEASEPTAIGETPNLAARLQTNAAAGEIVLSEEAFRRVREWLKEQNLSAEKEQITLKGFPEPVPAHRLRGGVRQEARR
jgi:class 3 adenylate cyclase